MTGITVALILLAFAGLLTAVVWFLAWRDHPGPSEHYDHGPHLHHPKREYPRQVRPPRKKES